MLTRPTEFEPDFASPPGETIEDILDERSMTQAELAERMGRPIKTVNEIIKGKTAISPETSLQLERVLGVPSSFWLAREQKYRERLARAKETENLKADVDWMKETFPLKKMADLGWLSFYSRRKDAQVEQLRHVLQYFGVASRSQWEAVWLGTSQKATFRKSLRFQSHPGSIAAWLRKGELDAIRVRCEAFSSHRFEVSLAEIRSLTASEPGVFVPRTIDLCARSGVAFVLTPQVRGARVSGVTRWLDPGKALIQLSLRYKTDDQFWFTFFHEAFHLILHGKREVFLEGTAETNNEQLENEADRAAADFLVPPKDFGAFIDTGEFDERTVRRFADAIGVAPGIVVGRLQHDGHVAHSKLNALKRSLDWADVIPTG